MLEAHFNACCVELLPDGSCWKRNAKMRSHFEGKPQIFSHHFQIEKSFLRFLKNQRASILFKFCLAALCFGIKVKRRDLWEADRDI